MPEAGESLNAWLMLAARVLMAVVFLTSGVHKGIWFERAAAEFRQAGIPAVRLTLAATVLLHIVAPLALMAGYRSREAALALAGFTLVATLKAHAWWRLPAAEQLDCSRMSLANLAIVGGLLLLAAVGPGPIAI